MSDKRSEINSIFDRHNDREENSHGISDEDELCKTSSTSNSLGKDSDGISSIFSTSENDIDSESQEQGFISSLVDVPTKAVKSTISSIASTTNWIASAAPRIPRSRSRRSSQISFDGFRPQGRNIFEKLLYVFLDFTRFIRKYIQRKIRLLVSFVRGLFVKSIVFSADSKGWLVKKLIWSRGKLGRPIATGIVTCAALVVFMFGEVFNNSKFVNSQEVNPEYLSNVSDIIPRKTVALTTIPESRKRSESFVYVVEGGDTLSSIGNKFKISVDAIKYVNNLTDSSVLKVGQELTIPPVSGLIHEVASGDTLESIANKYDVASQAIADFNYILDTSSLSVGDELVIPGAKVPEPVYIPTVPAVVAPPVTTVDPNAGGNWCIWPLPGGIVTQYFSWYHNGLDIAEGGWLPPLYACGNGTVIRSGWDPFGLGLHVRIDHGNGYETVYGHMSRLDVGVGQRVSQGQVIGIMGSTGRSTGPHVHFMVKYNGVAQNPLNYVR